MPLSPLPMSGLLRTGPLRYSGGMSRFRSHLLIFGLCIAPVAALAHPHVFIDTTLRAAVDADGTFTGLEVEWAYDDFYSLLIFADMGLDTDGDGQLSPEEVQQLEGFDLQWIEGFEGDSYAIQDGQPVALGTPEFRAARVEGGRIITTHFRAAQAPAAGLQIKAYDPTLYTAYALVGQVEVDGPCTTIIDPADLDSAYSRLEELLFGNPVPDGDGMVEFPAVGESFADTVTLSCEP